MTKKVSFNLSPVYVADASNGILVGDFNNWNVDKGIFLEKQEDGSMLAELNLTPGKTYQYRYLLSDGRWVNDDNAKKTVEAFGQMVENCVIDVPLSKTKTKTKKMQSSKPLNKIKPEKNNLTEILGVTKEIEKAFNNDEIKSFSDLGKCTMKRILLILVNSG